MQILHSLLRDMRVHGVFCVCGFKLLRRIQFKADTIPDESWLHLQRVHKFAGRKPGHAPENAGKILGIIKRQPVRNLAETVPVFTDKFFGIFDFFIRVILHKRNGALCLEHLAQIGFGVTEMVADVRNFQGILEMRRKIRLNVQHKLGFQNFPGGEN